MNWVVKLVAYVFAGTITVAGLTIIASVMLGVMAAGNLWLLLPLALYAVAFWLIGSAVNSL